MQEEFGTRIQYEIPSEGKRVDLAVVFDVLESSTHLEEYAFSQSTLEQVFLRFAKKQELADLEESTHNAPATNV